MKKIIISLLTPLFLLLTQYSETQAQTPAAAKKSIEQANKQFINWFNNAQADSIITQYHTDACLTDRGCGKAFIKEYYQVEAGKYKMKDLTTLNVTVKDNSAMETGTWKLQLASGYELTGKYSTEWRLVKNKWLIFKETIVE